MDQIEIMENDNRPDHDPCFCNGNCGKSRARETINVWLREDAYGIPTGFYCDDCYDSDRYPYRRDRYDHDEALEPEEYY